MIDMSVLFNLHKNITIMVTGRKKMQERNEERRKERKTERRNKERKK